MNNNLKFLRWLGVVIIFVIGIGIFPALARAATTATVTVSATPSWVAMTNGRTGAAHVTNLPVYVVPTSITDSSLTTPVAVSVTPSTTDGFFSMFSQSTVAINVSVWGTNWTGGSVWTLSDSAVPGSAIVGMYAGITNGSFGTVIKTSPGSVLKSLAANDVGGSVAGASQSWHLKVMIPTVFQDGIQKSTVITLSAAAS